MGINSGLVIANFRRLHMAVCVAVFSYPRFEIVYLSSDFRLGRSGNGAVSVLNPTTCNLTVSFVNISIRETFK